ncbi:hypothetical protein HY416_01525 [Candidatus Kaiserbacteria bacterium]|nr:hypothetical protein [Candidatus Kaiserbacteria bacterium]
MDVYALLAYAKEFLPLIVVFGALLAYAAIRGNRALITLLLGLYIALLVSLKFPYYDAIYGVLSRGESGAPIAAIIVFVIFTVLATLLFGRLLPRDYREIYEGVPKKILLAVLATILVMAYSYHVLPVTALFDPGSAVGALFSPPQYFFWLLLLPLIGLFFI